MRSAATLMLLILIAPLSARGEDYIVRIESLDLTRELDGRLAEHPRVEQLNLNDEPKTITESIEVKVKAGERFYGKAIRDAKVFEIRGRLKSAKDRDHVTLEIEAAEYVRTSEWVPDSHGLIKELTVGQRVKSTVILDVGQPLRLGQMHSTKSGPDIQTLTIHDFWVVVDVVGRSEQ